MKGLSNQDIELLLKNSERLPFAIENYPSRGQTAVQELYQTNKGKLFLKRVSERNHSECQIDVGSGTLAEREYWAFCLAKKIGLLVPHMWLLDKFTTVQIWFDYPDGRTYKKSTGKMEFLAENIFNCSAFDWVTGQIDRHDANYLFDYTERQIIPVDSAHGFLKYEGALPDYIHLFEVGNPGQLNKKVNSGVKQRLNGLSDDEIRKLVPLRNKDEESALLARRSLLVSVRSLNDLLDLFRRR